MRGAALLMQAAHQAADFLEIGVVRDQIGDDVAAIHHEDAVRKREDLIEIRGNDEDAPAAVAHLDEDSMDGLDCPDVDAARWLFRDDEPRPPRQLARKLKLLLVAAGERSGQCHVGCAAHVELADQLARPPLRRIRQQDGPTRKGLQMAEGKVLPDLASQGEADALAVRRNIGEPGVAALPGLQMSHLPSADRHGPCDRAPQAGDAFDELVLTVALHAGESDDLARPDRERRGTERSFTPVAYGGQAIDLEKPVR